MEASCGHPPREIRSPQATGARAVMADFLDNLAKRKTFVIVSGLVRQT
jgi:hypothetical protein